MTAPRDRGIPSEVFRAYDIRGIAPDPLSPELVHAIGWSIAREARALGETRVAIGRDGRLTGPEFRDSLAAGLLAGGVSVVDMGQLPTPLLYFGAREIGSGIMITGSHNPPDYNGLKITLAGETLFGERIRKLRERLEAHGWPATPLVPDAAGASGAAAAGAAGGARAGAAAGVGVAAGDAAGAGAAPGGDSEEGRSGGATADRGGATLTSRDPREDYLRDVTGRIAPGRRLRVAVDAGNGITGPTAPRLLRALGHDVIELHCEVDGRFPNHPPDTSVPESYADLSKAVVESEADLGLAFDGDGDRLGVVDGAGEIIWPDRFMMLYAEEILARRPGATFVHDVKCTRHLGAFIAARGGRVVMGRTGHSYIKKMLKSPARRSRERCPGTSSSPTAGTGSTTPSTPRPASSKSSRPPRNPPPSGSPPFRRGSRPPSSAWRCARVRPSGSWSGSSGRCRTPRGSRERGSTPWTACARSSPTDGRWSAPPIPPRASPCGSKRTPTRRSNGSRATCGASSSGSTPNSTYPSSVVSLVQCRIYPFRYP